MDSTDAAFRLVEDYDFADIFTNSFAGTMPDRVITGNGALIYCGVLSVVLLILLLFLKCSWKKKVGYFLLIGVMWLSMMHQNLYVMWHGFSMPMGVAAPFFFPVQFSCAGGGRACVPDMGNRAGER